MPSLRRPALALNLAPLLASSLTVTAAPTQAWATDALLSQGKPATASSKEGDELSAAHSSDASRPFGPGAVFRRFLAVFSRKHPQFKNSSQPGPTCAITLH
ncbi:hypothetical protein GCM10010446_64880 [Streptomyces enissocaesilis]|uniref:Uncharacterized protein n=1 Tax=Streptomyces enissocaesilis TaxID=332589 RepID=A0ABN3XMV5_9ACTN